MVSRALGAALGVAADQIFGEPPLNPHPVAVLGCALRWVEERLYADSRWAGVAHTAAGVAIAAATGAVIGSTSVATYVCVAGRALGAAALDVDNALQRADLDRARVLLPSLVGRDAQELDEGQLCRAVVESVAENTVDAVVAPALWATVGGAPGVVAHRAVDTMDSMVGYRNDTYERYGWAAARLDDAAAWIPARVTAGLVAGCRPRRAGQVLHAVRTDAPAHPSPNSGVAEAAFAAALGLRLGGENSYGGRAERRPALGSGRAPRRSDIARAVRLSRDVSLALAGLLAGPALARAARR